MVKKAIDKYQYYPTLTGDAANAASAGSDLNPPTGKEGCLIKTASAHLVSPGSPSNPPRSLRDLTPAVPVHSAKGRIRPHKAASPSSALPSLASIPVNPMPTIHPDPKPPTFLRNPLISRFPNFSFVPGNPASGRTMIDTLPLRAPNPRSALATPHFLRNPLISRFPNFLSFSHIREIGASRLWYNPALGVHLCSSVVDLPPPFHRVDRGVDGHIIARFYES